MIVENDSLHAFLNGSENILKEKVFSLLSIDDDFNKEFKEVLFNCFCNEEKKNGYFFSITESCTINGETVEKILFRIYSWFGVSTLCVYDSDNVEDIINVKKLKFSLYHCPLIIAYKCSYDTVFKIQRIVGDLSNIIWIN